MTMIEQVGAGLAITCAAYAATDMLIGAGLSRFRKVGGMYWARFGAYSVAVCRRKSETRAERIARRMPH